ncbi:MAG: S-adenosylmethionine decarboxylase, partial [Candidatus Nealsonbacteria bacterium]
AKKKSKNKKTVYGMELILDLHGCDPKVLASRKKLQEFVIKICQLIKMKRYGKPFLARFGFGKDFTAGYSLVQLIESSSISGHFSELWSSAYINIFSCKPFSATKARAFTKKFFKAKSFKNRLVIRK